MVVHYPISGTTASAIATSVERAVRDGALAPGDALPPVRGLALSLGVSPGTVAAAYRTLRDRAVVVTAGRRGTRVRARPSVATGTAGARHLLAPGVRAASTGAPDPALLPALRPLLRELDPPAATYGDPPLLPALRDAAGALLTGDGVPAAALTATAGALDGIERTLVTTVHPGDRVAVEDPGWPGLLDLLPALGLVPVPVRVDDEGPAPDALAAALGGGARAAVLTVRAQNPTGAVLTAGRAGALRRVLRRHPDVLVIEDDHAAQLASHSLAPLAGITDSWVFVRSFAKPYGPDLRLAVLAGDAATVSRIDERRLLGSGWVSYLMQALGVALLDDPQVARTVTAAAAEYGARRVALREQLAARGITSSGEAGLNVWVPVPDETAAVTALLAAGWLVAPGARFRLASPPAIRITVSAVPVPDAGRLAAAVGAALRVTPGHIVQAAY